MKKYTVIVAIALLIAPSLVVAQTQVRVPPDRLRRVETVADLSTAKPRDGDAIALQGYNSAGDGGGQILVYNSASSATVDNIFTFDGPGGVGRYLAVDRHIIIAERAGLVGDHTTDNQARFQAIIDSIMAGTTDCREIVLTAGRSYQIDGPILIGLQSGGVWQQAANLTIRGGGGYASDQTTDASSTIFANFTDSFGVGIQSARNINLVGLRILGISNFASSGSSAFTTAGTTNNYSNRLSTQTNFNPVTNAAREHRYSPSCCVAIDPFGVAVAEANWYPGYSATEYVGNAGSSKLHIDKCAFMHMNAGVVVGAGTTVSGSEIYITNSMFFGLMYGISTCHTQNKNIFLERCAFDSIWGVVSTVVHGAQQGIAPTLTDCHGSSINHFIYDTALRAGFTMRGGLFELVMRMSNGVLGPAFGAASGAVRRRAVFEDLDVTFAGTSADTDPMFYPGLPPYIVRDSIFLHDSTRKFIIQAPSTSQDFYKIFRWGDPTINAQGGPISFERCWFGNGTSPASLANTMQIDGDHPRWVNFDFCTVYGTSAGSNTRLVPLNGRGLNDPSYNARIITIPVVPAGTNVATGDGKAFYMITPEYKGAEIVKVYAWVGAAGTTGTTDIQVARVRGGTPADVLSTKSTIDSGETNTTTAAAASVVNVSNDDLTTADFLRIDVDAVSTTPPTGLWIQIELTPGGGAFVLPGEWQRFRKQRFTGEPSYSVAA